MAIALETGLYCRTRTGKQIHYAFYPTSTTTKCGVWLKTDASRYAVPTDRVRGRRMCSSCFMPQNIEAAVRDDRA